MNGKKEILLLNGSASAQSSNEKLIRRLVEALSTDYVLAVYYDLKVIPHFDPERSVGDVPAEVHAIREAIERAAAMIICTPEYIYSIPSALKNVLEWCVATTIFTDKRVGVITASAGGEKGHEELQMILRTLMARLNEETTLLIPGIKGKMDSRGEFTDEKTKDAFERFMNSFRRFLEG
jgi:chromate reductase